MSTTIGRYEVIRELGTGGMATVYLAQDPLMKRQVAVKVLPRQFTFDPNFRARFQREVEVIAGLEHPAIVPVYDFGETDEQPYIVMRYMPGGSLADRMEKSPLSLKEIAAIFQRLAAALDAIHKTKLVHRDLKPANVLFDQWGEAYLSDFGIVKIAESHSMQTGTGIIGTPAYMSPEQAAGKDTVDGRSDIYSLGVILYELLTGQQPYIANTPMGQALAHIVEPVPNILATAPKLPKACEAIIRHALAKNPNDRYQTCQDLADIVNQLATNPNIVVPRPTPSGRGVANGPLPKAKQALTELTPAARSKINNRPNTGQTAKKESRSPIAFAFTGATIVAIIGLGLIVCVGGVFAISFLQATPTPTITNTHTATSTRTSTPSDTPTFTVTPSQTFTATITETETPTATNTRLFFTATLTLTPTPAFTATPVCNSPEFFDPALNRCRTADSNNSPQPNNPQPSAPPSVPTNPATATPQPCPSFSCT